MAFFDDFTAALKQKWLQYFQLNHGWMALQMEVESVKTPDGGRRPPSYLILGVLNALEPKLAQLMFPFAKLNPDPDTIIDVLELHFDPDIALGNRPAGKAPTKPSAPAIAPKPAIEETSDEDDEFGGMELGALGTEVAETPEEDAFGGMALDDLDAEESGALGSMALEDMDADVSELESDESLADLGDLSMDAWSEETSEESSEESMEGFGDMTFDAFGEEVKTSEEEGLDDAFGDMTFEDLGESSDQEDEWK